MVAPSVFSQNEKNTYGCGMSIFLPTIDTALRVVYHGEGRACCNTAAWPGVLQHVQPSEGTLIQSEQ